MAMSLQQWAIFQQFWRFYIPKVKKEKFWQAQYNHQFTNSIFTDSIFKDSISTNSASICDRVLQTRTILILDIPYKGGA